MNIAIIGALGKMGKIILGQAYKDSDMHITYALIKDKNDQSLFIKRYHDVEFGSDQETAVKTSDVIIDFSNPELSMQINLLCKKYNKIHILGTTGFTSEQFEAIKDTANTTQVVYSANFSIGVNLLASITEKVSNLLKAEDFDIEILEMHHNQKVDSPSGTALLLGSSAAKGRKVELDTVKCDTRSGNIGKRKTGEIGFATLRGGSIVGEHSVLFTSNQEMISLSHRALSREVFANGALFAAKWAYKNAVEKNQKTGFFTMNEILNI